MFDTGECSEIRERNLRAALVRRRSGPPSNSMREKKALELQHALVSVMEPKLFFVGYYGYQGFQCKGKKYSKPLISGIDPVMQKQAVRVCLALLSGSLYIILLITRPPTKEINHLTQNIKILLIFKRLYCFRYIVLID